MKGAKRETDLLRLSLQIAGPIYAMTHACLRRLAAAAAAAAVLPFFSSSPERKSLADVRLKQLNAITTSRNTVTPVHCCCRVVYQQLILLSSLALAPSSKTAAAAFGPRIAKAMLCSLPRSSRSSPSGSRVP